MGAVAMGGAMLGLSAVAQKWGVTPILKRYKSMLSGPDGNTYIIKALRAMMDQATRQGTLTGFRAAPQVDVPEEEDNEPTQTPPNPGSFRYNPDPQPDESMFRFDAPDSEKKTRLEQETDWDEWEREFTGALDEHYEKHGLGPAPDPESPTDARYTRPQDVVPDLYPGDVRHAYNPDRLDLQRSVERIGEVEPDKRVSQQLRELYIRINNGKYVSLIDEQLDVDPTQAVKQMAFLTQAYHHPSVEKYHAFYLKDSRIIGHHAVGVNAYNTTDHLDRRTLRERAQQLGADAIIDMHNHPLPEDHGGFSGSDKMVFERSARELGDLYKGSVVIDGDQVQAFDAKSGGYTGFLGLSVSLKDFKRIVDNEPKSILDSIKSENRGFWENLFFDKYKSPMFQPFTQEQAEQMASRQGATLHPEYGQMSDPNKDEDKVMTGGMTTYPEIEDEQSEGAWLIKYGEDLQTRDNWINLIFTNIVKEKRVQSIVAYKNLHHLDPDQLASYISMETKRWGGNSVYIVVGEGDWYSEHDDIGRVFSHAILARIGVNGLWAEGLEHPLFYNPENEGINKLETTLEHEIYGRTEEEHISTAPDFKRRGDDESRKLPRIN